MTYKYAIGDVVGTLLHVEELRRFSDSTEQCLRPDTLRVEERLSIECVGGAQLFYGCRDRAGFVQKHSEDMLVPAEVVWDAWADGLKRQEARKDKP